MSVRPPARPSIRPSAWNNAAVVDGFLWDLNLKLFRKSVENIEVSLKSDKNSEYTGCPRRNVKYFGRVFLMLNYTDITQNTYIQSW